MSSLVIHEILQTLYILVAAGTFSKLISGVAMAQHNDIVLFHYSFSPYARKVLWYLALRGIEYGQCVSQKAEVLLEY